MNNINILECKNITKVYSGTKALDDVGLEIKKGNIHALVGENGAGKSTLSNIISGLQRQTSGELYIEGKYVDIKSTAQARSLGITIMTQELDYCPNLTVAGNVFLGQERKKKAVLDWDYMNSETQKVLDRLGVDFKPTDKAEYLSISQKQQMQLARILFSKAKLILMDEPTSSLNGHEVDILFKILKSLKSEDLSIIYISHHMEEIFRIADMVTVLRDGKLIDTKAISNTSPQEVISMIIGREQKFTRFKRVTDIEETKVLEVKNLTQNKIFSDVNFSLKKGEVYGFFGLRGSGTEKLLQAIFGVNKIDRGELYINNKKSEISINKAIANKMVFLPSNRREEGICRTMNVRSNLIIGSLHDFTKCKIMNYKKASEKSREMINKLQVDCKGINQLITHLSGGNQQKVIFGRSMLMNANLLLISNPTRGIDVGAKVEIYKIIRELSDKGISVIITSSETTDILSVCDRVLVMRKGKISAEFDCNKIDEKTILHAAMV